jgi:prepilin signal peptidase PulO-like enzyme (type II secretory pathway)
MSGKRVYQMRTPIPLRARVRRGISLVTYHCPVCGHEFDAVDLQRPAGIGGGSYCPKCQERLRVSFPYSRNVAVVSLLLAIAALLVMRVTSVLWFVGGIAVLWLAISLLLNAYSTRFKPPTLKKWKPRTRKTFFEWLYERDQIRAPKMNDPDKKDS